MYVILDIETTGGKAAREKITEIALYKHDGSKIIDSYSTLINPERSIPYYITQITNITNEMVQDAPKFYEVAKKIITFTEDSIIVGHNIYFDYSFLRKEYAELKYDYKRKSLCTVRLSKKLLPGLSSYRLGNLTKELAISHDNPHRAEDDALATVRLFEILLEKAGDTPIETYDRKKQKLWYKPANLPHDLIDKLPESPGVYTFYDKHKKPLYVGKSKNIQKRVISHFQNQTTEERKIRMSDHVFDIQYEETGNELTALLLEAQRIKELIPFYNRKQKLQATRIGLYAFENEEGYRQFILKRVKEESQAALMTFSSIKSGTRFIDHLCDKFDLPQNCFHIENRPHFFDFSELKVLPKELHNVKAEILISQYQYRYLHFLLLDKGREENEISFVWVEDGQYRGFGYLPKEGCSFGHDFFVPFYSEYNQTRDIKQFVLKYEKGCSFSQKVEINGKTFRLIAKNQKYLIPTQNEENICLS